MTAVPAELLDSVVAQVDPVEVWLFGSRARGDARPDSDYDVAVFLRDIGGVGEEIRRLVDLGDDILVDTGAVISAVALPEGAYREGTGFMAEVRRDGVDL